jgi:murein DD-endopeptidase MepM/ murein hydrolase activator NlpD
MPGVNLAPDASAAMPYVKSAAVRRRQERCMSGRARSRILAAVAVLALGLPLAATLPAHAESYPSWSDVQKARKSAGAKAKEVSHIHGLIKASKDKVDSARKAAEQRGAEYAVTRDRVDEANDRLNTVKQEVAAERRKSQAAQQRAGQMAAQLARTGGTDLQTSLFLEGSSSSDGAATFLSKLGRLSKLTQDNGAIANAAEEAKNSAAATQAQFTAVSNELAELKQKAQVALDAAVKASQEADDQLEQQQQLQATLQAQLDALNSTSDSTFSQYQAGVRARQAAAAARAAAARGGGGASTRVLPSGWAHPAYGPITDVFGARPDRPAGANPNHRGTDIGAGCGSSIYAAHSGTVIYASRLGTYGNFVEINNGGGISTGYAHIRDGGTFVHVGQHVSAGQNIASVGTTGASTGCHLHYEVRINETAIDAQPFMAARGITLG